MSVKFVAKFPFSTSQVAKIDKVKNKTQNSFRFRTQNSFFVTLHFTKIIRVVGFYSILIKLKEKENGIFDFKKNHSFKCLNRSFC